jgi:hypothetical protein
MKRSIELSISCADCIRQSTPDCDDCLVSYVIGETPDQLTMTGSELAVAELLSNEGLVPSLKFVELRSAKTVRRD